MAGKIRANVEEIKNILRRREMKFIGGFLLIIVIGLVLWQGTYYFSPEARQHREAVEYFENLDEQYRNDTYGGETPEETLTLFKQALEEENIELASKYFLPDDREKIKGELEKELNIDGNFDHLIDGLNKLKRTTGKHDQSKKAFYIITNEDNLVTTQVVLAKNPETKVWKITDL